MVRYRPIAARSLPWQRDEAIEIDRKTVRGGKMVYRAAVGSPVLDTKFLSTLGDFGYALNWPFPVRSRASEEAGAEGRLWGEGV
jgi:hypothetical protein